MTAITPCKIIRYENYCLNKRTPTHPSVQSAGSHSHMPETDSNKLYSIYGLGAGAEFDDQLLAFEKIARHQYSKIIESLTFKKLPRWLDQMLAHSIFPTLHRFRSKWKSTSPGPGFFKTIASRVFISINLY